MIGVILVLISISVIGYQVVERSAAANQTKVTLEALNSMIAELDANAGIALPSYGQNIIGAGQAVAWQVGDVTSGGADRAGPVVTSTAGAMASLMKVPSNQKAVSQLPGNKNMPIGGSEVLLDGWGNPIIYVPPGGITVYVTTGAATATQVTMKSRDNRPFFASAGPDGDFGATTGDTTGLGDDNVYSDK